MISKVESLELAEKILSLSNFKLKRLCRKAKETYAHMRFDPRDNASMREALWSLETDKLASLIKEVK